MHRCEGVGPNEWPVHICSIRGRQRAGGQEGRTLLVLRGPGQILSVKCWDEHQRESPILWVVVGGSERAWEWGCIVPSAASDVRGERLEMSI